ncbi:hypothetical protein T308_01580 [Streptococcus pneumoniae A026]|nr:hypothetical protein T308_01580 [Streptococcus pneumoniae A026]
MNYMKLWKIEKSEEGQISSDFSFKKDKLILILFYFIM